MSVISRTNFDKALVGFVKGSPEKIKSICIKNSLPANYDNELRNYTEDGLRVLALAYKYLPNVSYDQAKEMKREQIESDVIFLGFLILQNKVKPETKGSLQKLQAAAINTLMATGDNGLTAVSVARECGIITCEKVAYLAELSTTEEGQSKIVWTFIDVPKNDLDKIGSNSLGSSGTTDKSEESSLHALDENDEDQNVGKY